MKYIWIFIFQTIWISSLETIQDVYFPDTSREISGSSEFIFTSSGCSQSNINQWESDFHECFMKRKYDDGGQNLESIVDRILDHAEACVETSGKNCRPDFKGFKQILRKVLEQMKDYSDMYLQAIYSGREKIKDLKCVEKTLSLDVYEDCFKSLPSALNKTDYEFQQAVRNGIGCTNDRDIECSKEARTSLNRIVRTIFGLAQPPEEDMMQEKEEPPPPKQWYETYITEPLSSAWEAIKSFFSNVFG